MLLNILNCYIMMSKLATALMLLVCFLGTGQERREVRGKVLSEGAGIADALVVNFTGQTETRTDSLGNFKLRLAIGDLLIISDYKIETKKIRYTQDLVVDKVLMLKVKQEVMQIEEVVINRNKNLTAYKLGITSTDIKLPTVAERRLRSSGGDPVSALINIFTGQDKVLKNAVQTEKRERALDKLDVLFDDAFYTESLRLNTLQIKAFKYYIVESATFREALELGPTGRIQFIMADMATEFVKLNNDAK